MATDRSERAAQIKQREYLCENLSFAGKEAFKRLRTNLQFSFPENEGGCSVVGITSSQPAEGKSLTTNDFTDAYKTKLDGIATGAEVNQNAFGNVKVGSTTIAADSKTDTLELVAGSNVTLTADATNDKVTIAATNTTYSNATTSTAGLMSASDKAKVDKLQSGFVMGTSVYSGTSTAEPQFTDSNLIGKSFIILTTQDIEATVRLVTFTDKSGTASTNGKVKVVIDRSVASIRFNYIAW